MNKLKEQLQLTIKKYSPIFKMFFNNMRLVLLVLFSVLTGYLVYRVDGLINKEGELPASDTASILSKKPDKDVISIFNELNDQQVTIESSFETDRENPF